MIYAWLEDPAKADEMDRHVSSFEEWIEQSGMHHLDWVVDFCRAISLNWRGRNEEALERIEKALATTPGDEVNQRVWENRQAGMIARELGRYAEAEDYLNDALELEPWSAEIHYQLALLFHEQGRIDKAREHIEKAMKVWENADPTVGREARKLAELLRESS
jgi:tetratricopeptide (TPR) repeat protein